MRPRVSLGAAGGFTLIELLTAIAVLSVLGGIALPSLRDAVDRADATKVVTDMAAVRQALFDYREDSHRLPRTSRWGAAPRELAPYLEEMRFTYKGLDYRLVAHPHRARVDFQVRYPHESRIGAAFRSFRRPASGSGAVIWNPRRTVFRLLDDNP